VGLMFHKMRRLKSIKYIIIDLVCPLKLSYFWNFGSLLLLTLMLQLLSGLLLACFYCPHIDLAFLSLVRLNYDTWFGLGLRMLHVVGARLYFFFLYLHLGRGIYYFSFFSFSV